MVTVGRAVYVNVTVELVPIFPVLSVAWAMTL
jgi:hypothetical protein